MENSLSTTVYYNQYSVDAVITAAYMKKNNNSYSFKPFTSYSKENGVTPIFVGCYPSGPMPKNAKVIHLSQMDTSDPDIEGLNYQSLLHIAFMNERNKYEKEEKSDIASVYSLMLALSQYNLHSSNMVTKADSRYFTGLDNLALIWSNWKKATKSLLSREEFKILPGDVDGFKEQIQILKARLNSDMKVVPIAISRSKRFKQKRISKMKSFMTESKSYDEVIRVPFINTNVNDAPWYGRLLSHTYDYGVLYEVVGNQIIVVPWSKDGESLPDLTYTINQHIGKDYTVVFANS